MKMYLHIHNVIIFLYLCFISIIRRGTNFILSPKIYFDTLLFNLYKNKIVYYYLQSNHIETCF